MGRSLSARAANGGILLNESATIKAVKHRRSIDLTAPTRKSPVEWPRESRRPTRYWQSMSDDELRRIGRYLRQQVEAGQTVHQHDLDDARDEWRRRHPSK